MSEERLKNLLATLVTIVGVGSLFFYGYNPTHPISVVISYLFEISLLAIVLWTMWFFARILVELIMEGIDSIRTKIGLRKIAKFGKKAFPKEEEEKKSRLQIEDCCFDCHWFARLNTEDDIVRCKHAAYCTHIVKNR